MPRYNTIRQNRRDNTTIGTIICEGNPICRYYDTIEHNNKNAIESDLTQYHVIFDDVTGRELIHDAIT